MWEWNEAFQWLLKKQVEALIGMGFDRKLKVSQHAINMYSKNCDIIL